DWGGNGPTLFVTSASNGAGDGLYSIDSTWSVTRLETDDNTRAVVIDEAGTFDAVGKQETYWSIDADLLHYPRTSVLAGKPIVDCTLITGGDILCSSAADSTFAARTITRIASGTHTVTDLLTPSTDFHRLVQGKTTGMTS